MNAQQSFQTTSSPSIMQVVDHIRDRAEVTPGVVAARFGEDSVTYGELAFRIIGFTDVMARQGMSPASAFNASLLTALPSLSQLSPDVLGDFVDDIVLWLSRGMSDHVEDLRAIG